MSTEKKVQLEERHSGSLITRREFLKIGGVGLAGATLLGTTGCNVFGGGQQGGGSRTLNTYINSDISSIDPTLNEGLYGNTVLHNVMDGLYKLDPDGKPVPAQAESVDISDDKTKYTFHLRDGIKWSNGDPVTSQDFKYSWLRGLDPEVGATYAYVLTYIKGAEEYNSGKGKREDVAIQTPDDRTLTVELTGPTPFLLDMVSHLAIYLPQKQSFVEQQGDKYASSPDALLYNGPYKLTKYNPTGGVVMEKNPDYWDADNVPIQKVNQKVIKEHSTALNLYRSGELDQVGLVSEDVPKYKDSPEFSKMTTLSAFYVACNVDKEAMANKNIRKALTMGFDRETLAKEVLNDGSAPAYGIVPDGVKGPGGKTFREAQGKVVDSNAGKAKQLWQKGVEELGREPKLEMLSSDNTQGKKVAQFLQGEYKKNLGANVNLSVKPFKAALQAEKKGNYQLGGALGWIMDFNDPVNILDLFTTESSYNYPNYSNKEYDRLIKGAKQETDQNKRMQMMLEAEKVLLEDVPIGPEFFQGRALLTKPYVKQWVFHQTGGNDYKYWRLGSEG